MLQDIGRNRSGLFTVKMPPPTRRIVSQGSPLRLPHWRAQWPALLRLKADLGDKHHSFYPGANYYIYGDRLKFMSGVEYSTAVLGD